MSFEKDRTAKKGKQQRDYKTGFGIPSKVFKSHKYEMARDPRMKSVYKIVKRKNLSKESECELQVGKKRTNGTVFGITKQVRFNGFAEGGGGALIKVCSTQHILLQIDC